MKRTVKHKKSLRMNGKKLRNLMARKELVYAPGACNALTAKLIEAAGFNSIHMSGYCTAAANLGLPLPDKTGCMLLFLRQEIRMHSNRAPLTLRRARC